MFCSVDLSMATSSYYNVHNCEFQYDVVTVTSVMNIIYDDVAIERSVIHFFVAKRC